MRWKSILSALALAIAVIVTPGAWGGAEAADAYVSLSSSPVNFGTVQVGSSDLENVQVTNTSSTTVYVDTADPTDPAFTQDEVSGPDTPRADACWFDGSGGHTRTQIDPGQSCLLYYRFTPGGAGSSSATSALTVYDFVGSPLDHDSVALTGTGQTVTPPQSATKGSVTVTPTSASFGSVNVEDSKTIVLTIKNTSNGNVQLTRSYPAGKPFADAAHQAGDCWNGTVSLVLATNDSCTVRPTFAPTAAGSFSGSLSIGIVASSGQRGEEEASPGSPPLATKAVSMSGTGVAGVFTLSPTSAAFGNVTLTQTKTLTITVKNTAKVPMMFKIPDPNDGTFAVDVPSGGTGHCIRDNGTTQYWGVAPNATCDFTATFAPFTAGAAKATYVVSAYRAGTSGAYVSGPLGGVQSSKNLNATGTGVAPTFTVTPTPLAFGNVTLTASKTLTAVVKNTSDVKLGFTFDATDDYEVVPASANAGHCVYEDTQGQIRHVGLSSGESCDVVLQFRPFTAGSNPSTLKIGAYEWPHLAGDGGVVSFLGDPLATKTVNVSGTGVAPTFTVTPTSFAFGNVMLSASKRLTAVVKNTSDVKLGFTFETTGDDYVVVPASNDQGHCVWEDGQDQYHLGVASGQSCDVVLEFKPFTAGSDPGTLKIGAYEWPHLAGTSVKSFLGDPLATKTVNASGTGVAPTFTVTPTPFAFGNVTASGSKRLTAVVKNTSTIALGFTFETTGDYEVIPADTTEGHCVSSSVFGQLHLAVASGGSCDVVLEFGPSKTGSSPGTLKIDAYQPYPGAQSQLSFQGDPLATKTVNASGTGVAPTFTVTPTSYNFGSVRTAESKSTMVEVHNTSNVTLQVAVDDVAPFWTGFSTVPFGALPAQPPCFGYDMNFQLERFQLEPGTSCWVPVNFEPTAGGSKSGSMPFRVYAGIHEQGGTYNPPGPLGPVLATKNFSASGTGVAPSWTVSPTSVSFGNVTAGATKSSVVTVTNTSDRVLQVGTTTSGAGYGVEVADIGFGPNPNRACVGSSFVGNPIRTFQLAPGDHCQIVVTFDPTTLGSRTGKLTISLYPGDPARASQYSDGAAHGSVAASKDVTLGGSGVAPTYTVTPSPVAFGNVKKGTTKQITATITNTSEATLQFDATAPAAPFSVFVPHFFGGGTDCFADSDWGPTYLQVGPGTQCTLTLGFSPTATGSKSGTYKANAYLKNPNTPTGAFSVGAPTGSPLVVKSVSASGNGTN